METGRSGGDRGGDPRDPQTHTSPDTGTEPEAISDAGAKVESESERESESGSESESESEAGGDAAESASSFASLVYDADVTRYAPQRRQRPAPSGTRGDSRGRRRPGPRADEPSQPPFRTPDSREPLLGAARDLSDKALQALERGEPAPQERIDLHGFRADAAHQRLGRALADAARRGVRCVLVIQGRGLRSGEPGGTLRAALPEWLTSPPCARHVKGFAPARPQDGGDGATYVLVRAAARRR